MKEFFNYKKLSSEELDYILRNVSFKIKPRLHQAISVVFAVDNDDHRVVFQHGVGSGKTLCGLFTTQLWKCKKILVITPSSAFCAWNKGIPQGTDYSYSFLTGTKKERISALKKKCDIYVINYEGLKYIYGILKPSYINKKGKVVKEWSINYSSLVDKFDCIIFDEVHRCSNYTSLQTKICLLLSKRAKYCIGMTGTSIDKSMLELFNLQKVVDLGKSFGLNFFMYRRIYFYESFYDWKLKDGAKEKILKRIAHNTISFETDECTDLPELQEMEIVVKPTKEFLDIEKAIIDGHCIDTGDVVINNENIKTKAQRLRQLSGGFLYCKGEDNIQEVFCLKKNPKLEALWDFIQDTDSKIVIFYWYKQDRILIEGMLKRKKIKYVSMYGGQNQIERMKIQKSFSNDSSIRVMTAQSRIAEGYDAFAANIAIFYLPLGSPRMRTQCIGRIYRSGQTKKCFVYDIIMDNSVDWRIIKDRSERFSLVNSVREYIQGYYQETSEI